MIRTLDVFVDQSTWPPTGAPVFPATFTAGASIVNVPMMSTLLLIGQLTTPPIARGVSLSEFWAWVRYLYAISPGAQLRISRAFASLDSHQKAILSDDFGMGIPIFYLINRLSVAAWSDGRYFMDRISALVSGPLPLPQKRGPRKAPDFVLLDQTGALHVVECKGGQSGPAARDRQLSHVTASGQVSGGVVQKRMVLVPAHLQGQRLACGLSLAIEGASGQSDLKIIDPEFDPEYDLSQAEPSVIRDPVVRAGLAKALRISGFSLAAATVAAPSGASARARPSEGFTARIRDTRRRDIDRRNADARAELQSPGIATFSIGEIKVVGREVSMILPAPLRIDGAVYRRAVIRQGVTSELIGTVLELGLTEAPLQVLGAGETKAGQAMMIDEGARAEFRIGGLFASEIVLD